MYRVQVFSGRDHLYNGKIEVLILPNSIAILYMTFYLEYNSNHTTMPVRPYLKENQE